jgi:glycopeptide antibiotics resistance protein
MNPTMLNNSNKHPPANTTLWLTVAYAMVLVYVTLHPVGAIRWTDAPAWGFVLKPWSKFGVTGFDVWINVLAYLPLGFGLAWLLGQSRVKRWGGKALQSFIQVLLALTLSAGLSFLLESLQSYSPVRVASTWDVVCNAGGALVGTLFAVAIKGRVSWIGRLLNHIIGPHRGALWAVIGLWGLAQMHPQGWSFMTAPLALVTEGWMPVQSRAMPLTAMQLQNLETIASVVALSGMLSLIRLGLHKRLNLIERSVCLLAGLVFILTWQTFSYSLQYG